MKKVKLAIVGAGFMAQEHAKVFSDISEVELVGIFSRTRLRAETLAQEFGIPAVYESIDSMYRATLADVVLVAVPELSVAGVCEQVFAHPWVSLIEKPVGYNLPEAKKIAALAMQRNRRAYVALNRRHYSSTRAVLDEVAAVGGQRLVHVFDQENPEVALAGGQPTLVVKNWMYANSIHIIDYLALFCRGEVQNVDHVIPWNSSDPRFVLTKFTFSSGDIGLYQAVWNAPGPWAVVVQTQAKRWEMRPLEQASVQLYKSRRADQLSLHAWDTQFKPGLRLQAEELLHALHTQTTKLPTLVEGLKTMELAKMIYET